MRCAIWIVGAAPSIPPKVRERSLGRYVKSMDAQKGTMELCDLPREALHFSAPGPAMRAWKEKLPNGELNELATKWSAQVITIV